MRWIVALLLVGCVAAPFALGGSQLRLATEILYLGLFAVSFNFLFNYVGLLSFGHNATFGAAAYAFAIAATQWPGASILTLSAVAAAAAVVFALVGSLLAVRLKGGYFAMMTLAWCQLLFVCAMKFYGVTRGLDGLMVLLPTPSIPFVPQGILQHDQVVYLVTLATVLVCCVTLQWFLATPLGRAAVLIRSNEERARFLGYNVTAIKIVIMTIASTVAGIAGILFALFQGLVAPSVLGFSPVGDVIFMTLLGGTGSLFAPFIGAVGFMLAEDRLSALTSHWRLIIGVLSVFLVLFLPTGVYGLVQKVLARPRKDGSRDLAVER